jgi:hypothetical protein
MKVSRFKRKKNRDRIFIKQKSDIETPVKKKKNEYKGAPKISHLEELTTHATLA